MKKLILALFASVLIAFQAKPQAVQMTGSDTVVNTATVNLDLKTTNNYDNVSFQLVTAKSAGSRAPFAVT